MSQVNTYISKGQFTGPLVTSASFAVGQSVWRVGDRISGVGPPSYNEWPERDEVFGKSHKGDDEIVSTCAWNF
jgi:hypothetical protein